MTKEIQNPNDQTESVKYWTEGPAADALNETAGTEYNLEERTVTFSERVIALAKKVPKSPVNNPLINQLVRAATSIGANYCEADNAVSKKEFRLKIALCQKEARETKYWLRMIAAAEPDQVEAVRLLWKEARELHLIFSAILRNTRPEQK
jgi:four helix bundle protein